MPKLTISLTKWAISRAVHIWITSRINFKKLIKPQSSSAVLKDKYTKLKWEKNEPKAIPHNIFSFTVDVDSFSTMLYCLKQIKHVGFKI